MFRRNPYLRRVTTWQDFVDSTTQKRDQEGTFSYSPIEHVPPEILADIFHFCLPETRYVMAIPQAAPLLLLQVCRRWRYTALSLPWLWSSVQVRWLPLTKLWAPSAALLQLWLRRSGVSPLSLAIEHLHSFEDPDSSDTVQPIIDIYAPHISRWRNIRLILRSHVHNPWLVLPPDLATAAALDDVIVELLTWPHFDLAQALVPRVRATPHLRTVVWTDYLRDPLRAGFVAPWRVLQKLDLTCPVSADACLGLLRLCPLLEIFCVDDVPTQSPANQLATPTFPPAPVRLEHLVALAARTHHDSAPLLDGLAAPALRELHLHQHGTPRVPLGPRIVEFLLRSQCTLAALHLTNATAGDIARCLMLSPELLELVLASSAGSPAGATDALLLALTRANSAGGGCLCPRLETLMLQGMCLCATDGVLADMTASRGSLRHLGVVFPRPEQESHRLDIQYLKAMGAGGLEVEMMYNCSD